jgi:hypothetical protein
MEVLSNLVSRPALLPGKKWSGRSMNVRTTVNTKPKGRDLGYRRSFGSFEDAATLDRDQPHKRIIWKNDPNLIVSRSDSLGKTRHGEPVSVRDECKKLDNGCQETKVCFRSPPSHIYTERWMKPRRNDLSRHYKKYMSKNIHLLMEKEH